MGRLRAEPAAASMARMRTRDAAWPFTLLLAAGCGGTASSTAGDPVPWRSLAGAELTGAQQRQSAAGGRARDALAKSLLEELTAAIAQHGARGAIGFCRERAPALAVAVGTQHGVRIGRTAARLRNPQNTAPAWASAAVAAAVPPASPQLLLGPGGELGMLQPIVLQPLCVACHGQMEQLAEGVSEALQQVYPGDRATGYAPGDLRGWFWIEVPKPE
jgi:hypothetical protein